MTDLAELMVTLQVVPETASQPLHQMAKERQRVGVAVRTTVLPLV